MTPAIHELTFETPDAIRVALDELLVAETPRLALESEYVDVLEDRIVDAQTSDRRLLFWAEVGGEPVGLIDLVIHSPEPGTATIAAIAVVSHARHRGIGRALVRHAIMKATERASVDVVAAGIHRHNADVMTFFSKLGMEQALGDDPNDPVIIVSGDPLALG